MRKIYVAGIKELSLIDYLNNPAFVIWFSGCNFRCKFCYNFELWNQKPEHEITIDNLVNKIKESSLLITACKVTGGEPTLQEEGLIELALRVKDMDLKFGLDTNASNPNIIEKMIYKYENLDAIAIDIKAPLKVEKYRNIIGINVNEKLINNIKKTLRIVFNSAIDHVEIRIPIALSINDNSDDLNQIRENLIELGYLDAKAKNISLVLFEVLMDKCADNKLRNLEPISSNQLVKLALQINLPNTFVRHRKIGVYAPLNEAIKALK
ncbi:MAG: anaerobic ribonucleoside-triphosphate reductase activating protein [Candidatus Methanomethylicota archaeon]|uniref:Anaerobic ribonucleoside-triphosphate reductase activating protein n=1 Tax=Thermoproteota archaeon TaxID=2056631 RepID=A0A497ESW2_9CREN|nr:MAG: anaerobic ribonucleoside-triphosphate reductase activating protein [Candidatus Verstraetearchaeota archaeon]